MINKLGFGFLRLPKKDGDFDWKTVNAMVDTFLEGGGTFFDTCYTYLKGKSEQGIRQCVAERKPRESFQLCEKLPGYLFKSYEDGQKFFDIQRERCGVQWFDVLMLHWLNDAHYAIAQKYDEFRFLREKKAQGLAKRIGFSYHGDAALLDRILTEHPEVDVVLLQLNYLDWESAGIQSRLCYETCVRHGKAVMAMEPVKGGTLATLPEEAEVLLRSRHPGGLGAALCTVAAPGGNLPQRHGRCDAGAGQHPTLCAPGRGGCGAACPGGGYDPQQNGHRLHRLRLLRKPLPQGDPHSSVHQTL